VAGRSTLSVLIAILVVAVAVLAWRLASGGRPDVESVKRGESSVLASESPRGLSQVESTVEPRSVASETAEPVEPIGATSRPSLVHLFGSLKNRAGELVHDSHAGVLLTDAMGENRRCEVEKGLYSFDNLPVGDYVLDAGSWGFREVRRTIRLEAGDTERHEDLVFDPAWMLRVKIETPDGEDLRDLLHDQPMAPMLQLAVVATIEAPGERFAASYDMERSGYGVGACQFLWSPEEKRDDRIQISADPPVHVSVAMRDIVLATQRVDTMVEEVTFTIGLDRLRSLLAGLTFRVLDGDTEAPATEASVSLTTAQSTEGGIRPDAEGRVTYEGRVPGLYEANILMKDRVYETVTAELQPGRVTDLGIIRLTRGVEIRGRCIDAKGQPHKVAPGLRRIADRTDAPREPQTILIGEVADEDGRFTIKHLPAGRYQVQITDPVESFGMEVEKGWVIVPTVVDTRHGPVDDLVLVVHRPSTLVLRSVSDAVDGMTYEVLTLDGFSAAKEFIRGSAAEKVELAPGPYTLRLTRSGSLVREVPFTLGVDTLTLTVQP
jgi:hypothetical protein